ncbi:dihydroorotase family protein [Pseudoclavibacter sp. AY1H1]|uniref:dihydroorotase n=1 Tax=Pseudoclavibacter sp. AY1H1 TaxID=2080584 RepID=UPI000CE91320|nr:amidohydrolase family protein [Pseudoclavibacter sp. AY1H1]PPF35380.1 amidohydrolase [Pseudoclavibacter sp. AY1H1]
MDPVAQAQDDLVATLIVRGKIRDPRGVWGPGEVWAAGPRIVAVHTGRSRTPAPAGARIVDVGDAYVLPGVVDAHVHSLSHGGEGIAAATRAATAGGVTTIVEMPYDGTGPINSLDRLRAKQDLANDEAHIDVALLGTLAPGGGWRAAGELADAGAAGFKVSLFHTHETRFPRIDDRELLSVMAAVRDAGRTLCTHAENNEIIQALLGEERAAGSTDPQSHSRSRPPVSETLGVLTALEVAADTGARLHVCHLSLPRSVDLVDWYRTQGADVTLETCPHYLTFTQDDLETQRGRLKINPPLRDAEARDGLWDRLGKGLVSVVSSDHAPWSRELKDHDVMLDNSSGAPGVQTLVAATLGGALRRDPSGTLLAQAVDALTISPARRYGLDARKGSLEVGKDADIVVFTPGDASIELDRMLSNAGWTPYEGMSPGGSVTHTFSRGELVYSDTAGLLARAGRGEVLV